MEHRASIISVITTPLGFFALSLLIIEGFLGIVIIGAGSTLSPDAKVQRIWIASGAFFVVIGLVTLLVWNRPTHLTFGGKDWNENAQYGTSASPKTKSDVQNLPANAEPTTEDTTIGEADQN